MDLLEAAANFVRSTKHCDNLVAVHGRSGGKKAGKRAEEVSVNRAIVVLMVGAWQAVIQDFTRACLDLGTPRPGDSVSILTYNLISGRVKMEINNFSTPDARRSRELLLAAGYDPRPTWTWTQHAGRGQGMTTWSPADADRRIAEWIRLRNSIAHGDAVLPAEQALQAVRGTQTPPADPMLRLVDAKQCLAFFRRLARLTSVGLAAHLGVSPPQMR